MKEKKLYEKSLIIAPRECWDDLYAYRKEYPLADFKILTGNQIEDLFCYSYDEEAVIYLLKKGYRFDMAKDMLRLLCHMEVGRHYENVRLNNFQPLLKEMVEQGLLFKTAYPEKTFEGRTIVYHGYPDTSRIRRSLERVKGFIASFPDEEPKRQDIPPVHYFPNVYLELQYVFNKIANLLDNGVNPEDVYIFGAVDSYANLLGRFGEAYGVPLALYWKRDCLHSSLGRAFMRHFEKDGYEKAVSFLEEDESEEALLILDTFARYQVSQSVQEKQHSLIVSLLKDLTMPAPIINKAVRFLKNPYVPQNGHVFFINFSLGNAPHSHKDDDYITSSEKRELYMLDDKEAVVEEKNNLKYLLTSGQVECITHARLTMEGECFDSPLVKEFKITVSEDNSLPYEYSKRFAALLLAGLKDIKDDYLKDNPLISYFEGKGIGKTYPFKDYDPQFKGFPMPAKKVRSYSYSSLDSFYRCPFRYYLGSVLYLRDPTIHFANRIGTIIHQVLERMGEPDYDSCFDQAYMDELLEEGSFSYKEEFLLRRIKKEGRFALEFVQRGDAKAKDPIFKREQEFDVPLNLDGSARLKGKIDKVVYCGPQHEYVVLIDYKSGASRFDRRLLKEGLSMQLPLYALSLYQSPDYDGERVIGLFISPIMNKNVVAEPYKTREETCQKLFRLAGIFDESYEVMLSFDNELLEGGSTYVANLRLTRNGGWGSNNRSPIPARDFEGFASEVREKAIEADKRVLKGDFPINPVSGANQDGCLFCPYGDICYKREGMQRIIELKEEGGEDDGEDLEA